MINEINMAELETQIKALNSLKREINEYQQKIPAVDTNTGGVVSELEEIKETMQQIQDELLLLVTNTVSYFEKRKNAIKTNENIATANIR